MKKDNNTYVAKTLTIRKNRSRSPKYWQGYVDALEIAQDVLDEYTDNPDTLYYIEVDAKRRLQGCLKTRASTVAQPRLKKEGRFV